MADYGFHADCYPHGHSRGGPCGANCPYTRQQTSLDAPTPKRPATSGPEYVGKHRREETTA